MVQADSVAEWPPPRERGKESALSPPRAKTEDFPQPGPPASLTACEGSRYVQCLKGDLEADAIHATGMAQERCWGRGPSPLFRLRPQERAAVHLQRTIYRVAVSHLRAGKSAVNPVPYKPTAPEVQIKVQRQERTGLTPAGATTLWGSDQQSSVGPLGLNPRS